MPTATSFSDLSSTSGSTYVGYQANGSIKVDTLSARLRRHIDLEDFMYPGDTSASVGFQRALNYLKANGGGKLMINGSYTYAAPVIYSSKTPLSIEGNGATRNTHDPSNASKNQVVLNYTGNSTSEFLVIETNSAASSDFLQGVFISNLMLYTADQAAGSGKGLVLRGVYGGEISNVTTVGFSTGILLDDNPSQNTTGACVCGKVRFNNISSNRASTSRMTIKGSIDITLNQPRLYEESPVAYDADLTIGDGTKGSSTNAVQVFGGALIGNNFRPNYNLKVTGNSFWINFYSTDFERSSLAGALVNPSSLVNGDFNTVTFNDCWWNDNLGHCGDFLGARVAVNNPRGGHNGTGSAFRFRGGTTGSPQIGGGVFGGVVSFANTGGVEVQNAAGVAVIGTEVFDNTQTNKPGVLFGATAVNCKATSIRPVLSTFAVQDIGGANSIIGGTTITRTGALDSSGNASFAHGLSLTQRNNITSVDLIVKNSLNPGTVYCSPTEARVYAIDPINVYIAAPAAPSGTYRVQLSCL